MSNVKDRTDTIGLKHNAIDHLHNEKWGPKVYHRIIEKEKLFGSVKCRVIKTMLLLRISLNKYKEGFKMIFKSRPVANPCSKTFRESFLI